MRENGHGLAWSCTLRGCGCGGCPHWPRPHELYLNPPCYGWFAAWPPWPLGRRRHLVRRRRRGVEDAGLEHRGRHLDHGLDRRDHAHHIWLPQGRGHAACVGRAHQPRPVAAAAPPHTHTHTHTYTHTHTHHATGHATSPSWLVLLFGCLAMGWCNPARLGFARLVATKARLQGVRVTKLKTTPSNLLRQPPI